MPAKADTERQVEAEPWQIWETESGNHFVLLNEEPNGFWQALMLRPVRRCQVSSFELHHLIGYAS